MNAIDNLDPMEINALFEKILNAPSFEDKQRKARERKRKAKADFFNLNNLAKETECIVF